MPLSSRSRKTIGSAIGGLVVLCVGVALWSLLWPVSDCDQPSCAQHRFTLGLELDALGSVKPIDFDVEHADETFSLAAILRGGGIELVPVEDQLGLPYDPSAGPLDPADLFQFVNAWRSRGQIKGVDATLYALFVGALIADNGEELFGIMFDTADREGFAVAPRTTERLFGTSEPDFIATLKLRTFAHEMLHALNRHHFDAAAFADGRLTLEAPTRCISEIRGRDWRLLEPPLMQLSPRTIRFFQSASARDVLPGRENSPYAARRASPTECDDARAQVHAAEDRTRLSVAMRRLRTLFGVSSAQAAEAPAQAAEFATIVLQAQQAKYPLGYPIAVRAIVRNIGADALPIVDRLNPRYGMLQIEYRREDAETWQPLEPITWLEPTSDAGALLPPGAQVEETIPVYFGEAGWAFDAAGDYQIRARLRASGDDDGAVSEPLEIAIVAPTTDDDRAVLQPLLNDSGNLDARTGQLLYFGGRIGDRDDIQPLEAAAERFGHTAVGAALRLTLISHRLRRPIDPQTGRRPPPNFDEARELLEDTCTDSGVAAMTSDLLRQRTDSIPDNIRNRSQSDLAAWDGVSASGAPLATYSNPSLQRWGPSLHFCFNESALRGPVRTRTNALARQLARERPSRIVLIGHSDAVGTCRFNDTLALERARGVQRALIAAGVRRSSIEIASVGERRPLDFAWTAAAQTANRRVEILVDGGRPNEQFDAVTPTCSNAAEPRR